MRKEIFTGTLRQLKISDMTFAAMIIGSLAFYDLRLVNIVLQGAFILCVLARVIMHKEPLFGNRDRNLLLLWYGGFILWALFSRLWAWHLDTFNSSFISLVQVAAIGIAIVFYLNSPRQASFMIGVLAATALVFCGRFILSVPVSDWGQERRLIDIISFSSNRGPLALAYISLVLVHTAFCRRKWVLLVVVLLSVFVALMFGTRKVLVFLGVGLLVLLFLQMKTRRQAALAVMVVLMLGLLSYYLLIEVEVLYGSIGYRIEKFIRTLNTGTGDGSTTARIDLIRLALDVIMKAPVIGIGLDSFRYESGTRATYVHNNYLEILANLGFIGLLMYYWYPMQLAYRAFLLRRDSPNMVLVFAFLVALLVNDILMVSYLSEPEHIFLCLMAGLYAVGNHHREGVLNVSSTWKQR